MRITMPVDLCRTAVRGMCVVWRASASRTGESVLVVRVEPEHQTLALSATDGAVAVSVRIPGTVAQAGAVALPAPVLHEMLAGAATGELTLATERERVRVELGSTRMALTARPLDAVVDWPACDGKPVTWVPVPDLATVLPGVLMACAAQANARYALDGVQVEIEPQAIRFVATDGHRLALCARGLDRPAGIERERRLLVPRVAWQAVAALLKADDEDSQPPRLGVTDQLCLVERGAWTVVARLMESKFPEYRSVMPKRISAPVVVDREALHAAIRRMAVFVDSQFTPGVRVEVTRGSAVVSVSNPAYGNAREEVPVNYAGTPFVTAFRADYMLDVLSVLDGPMVELAMETPMAPCRMRSHQDERDSYLVMPISVSN